MLKVVRYPRCTRYSIVVNRCPIRNVPLPPINQLFVILRILDHNHVKFVPKCVLFILPKLTCAQEITSIHVMKCAHLQQLFTRRLVNVYPVIRLANNVPLPLITHFAQAVQWDI